VEMNPTPLIAQKNWRNQQNVLTVVKTILPTIKDAKHLKKYEAVWYQIETGTTEEKTNKFKHIICRVA